MNNSAKLIRVIIDLTANANKGQFFFSSSTAIATSLVVSHIQDKVVVAKVMLKTESLLSGWDYQPCS